MQTQVNKDPFFKRADLSCKLYQVYNNTLDCFIETYTILLHPVNYIHTNNALNKLSSSVYSANCSYITIFNETTNDKRQKDHAKKVMDDLYHQYKIFPTRFKEFNTYLDTFRGILNREFIEKPLTPVVSSVASVKDSESVGEPRQELEDIQRYLDAYMKSAESLKDTTERPQVLQGEGTARYS
jgi:hypothetical protein